MRTPIGTILAVAVCALALCVVSEPALADDFQADVVVCGSSPAAVTAAVKAKDMGLEVVIVSPELHIGGLSVSGLGFTDSGNTAAIGGLAREFYRRIYREYMKPETWRWQRMEDFKADGQDTKAICHGDKTMWTFEPHVAEKVFAEWLAEKGVAVRRGEFLDRERGVEKKDGCSWCLASPRRPPPRSRRRTPEPCRTFRIPTLPPASKPTDRCFA
jgi:hypothetical protein